MPQISDRELGRLKQSLEELSTLNQIASAINVTMSVDKITSTIIDHCCRRTNASQGATFLLESEEQEADRFRTFVRQKSSEDELPFHLSLSLQGWMIKNRAILVSNDPANDDRLFGADAARIGLRSLIAAPLLSRKGLLGLLVLFNKKGDGGFDDRDKRFLGIVGTQVAKVIENARLFEQEQELLAVRKEMTIARDIQARFLPKENISTDRIEVFGFNTPASDVGGDYYDMVPLSPDRVFFAIGDVSGHGIPAALLTGNAMAATRSQLLAGADSDLPQLASGLNELICQFTGPDRYITSTFGILDGQQRKISYVNAGHLPPIIIRADGTVEKPDEADVVIGVVQHMVFNTLEIDLNPGDVVHLYTDGIHEAANQDGVQFGLDRLERILVECRATTSEALIDRLLREIKSHCGAIPQDDDITLLLLRLKQ